jgi:hypothetical protein
MILTESHDDSGVTLQALCETIPERWALAPGFLVLRFAS